MSKNYFRTRIKVKRIYTDNFTSEKDGKNIEFFKVYEDGGLVEPSYKVKKEVYERMQDDKVAGKEIEIFLERKMTSGDKGKLFNNVGEEILFYKVLDNDDDDDNGEGFPF